MKRKLKTSKQTKKILLALSLVASTLPVLMHFSTPKNAPAMHVDAEWHLDGKVRLDKK